ncbi:MAG: glycosyltransferase family A protein [Actinomycetota bacterium]
MNTKPATVSVVIPVHNGMPHLAETLASVLNQTRMPDEIVVVENGSTDGTAEWLTEHAPAEVRVIVQPSMVSAAENFTSAIRSAGGDLVKLLCADDVLEPTSIEVQSRALEQHPAAALAASQRRIVDNWGSTVVSNRGLGRLNGEVDGREVIRACALRGQNLLGEPCAVMFRRAAIDQHLPWDDSLPYVIDLDLYTRVLAYGTAVAIRESLAQFRMSTGSWSTQLNDVQRVQFEEWRDRAITTGLLELSPSELLRSRLMARVQHALRRAAYRVTAIRARRRPRATVRLSG